MNKLRFFAKAAELLDAATDHTDELKLNENFDSASFSLDRGEIAVIAEQGRYITNKIIASIINQTCLEAKTPLALINWHDDGLDWLAQSYQEKYSEHGSFLELSVNQQFFEHYAAFLNAVNSGTLNILDDFLSEIVEVIHSCIRAKTANKSVRFIIIDDLSELTTGLMQSSRELTSLFGNLAGALDCSILFRVNCSSDTQKIDFDSSQSVSAALSRSGFDVNGLAWFGTARVMIPELADVSSDFQVKIFRPGRIITMSISQSEEHKAQSTATKSTSLEEPSDKFDNDALTFLSLHKKAWSNIQVSDIQRLFKLSYSRSQRIFDALNKDNTILRDQP